MIKYKNLLKAEGIPRLKELNKLYDENGNLTEAGFAVEMLEAEVRIDYESAYKYRLMARKAAITAGVVTAATVTSYLINPEWTVEAIKTLGTAAKDTASFARAVSGTVLDSLAENIPQAAEKFSDTMLEDKWKTTKLIGGVAVAGAAILSIGSIMKGKQRRYHDWKRPASKFKSERLR